jgi:hypothetical protein
MGPADQTKRSGKKLRRPPPISLAHQLGAGGNHSDQAGRIRFSGHKNRSIPGRFDTGFRKDLSRASKKIVNRAVDETESPTGQARIFHYEAFIPKALIRVPRLR